MPSLRKEREDVVADLTKDLESVGGLVVAGYVGVKTPELNELRDKLRPLNSRCTVVKNTLAKIALKNAGVNGGFSDHFDGQSALVIQKGDALASLKVLVDFEKAHANFKIRAGHMEGRTLSVAEVKAMAALPTKKVLLSMLLSRLQGPLQGFHSVLTGPVRYLASALDQAAKKKAAAGAQ
jgi:large subunit ribosomal protein L10